MTNNESPTTNNPPQGHQAAGPALGKLGRAELRGEGDLSAVDAQVVELDGVWFGYEPGRAVVKGLSARLCAGRVCALIGPNAVGKTTLLRLILGQLLPWSGSLTLAGRPVASWSGRQRAACISYVPQHGRVSFAFTAEQVVAMGRFALPADAGAIEQAIEACHLRLVRQRVYAQLSAGQQQRVLLARAMAQAGGRDPDPGPAGVMLLDEPVSSMDLRHLHRTMRLLVQLSRSGLAVLVVLHDLNLAARYADDVWLMRDGTLAASGPWSQVLRPDLLEPAYGISVRPLDTPVAGRPMFFVDEHDTLNNHQQHP